METSASFEARSAPPPYPATVETSASFEARYAPLSYPTAPTLDRSGREVARFGATTAELIRMAEWLKARQVESVALESTGVYWIAPHEVLEGQGLQVLLVDTR